MTNEQREALKIVEAEVLCEATDHEHGEFVNVANITMARAKNGEVSAIPTGKYVIGYNYTDNGAIHLTLFTDYGFCKSECSLAEIAENGYIEFY